MHRDIRNLNSHSVLISGIGVIRGQISFRHWGWA